MIEKIVSTENQEEQQSEYERYQVVSLPLDTISHLARMIVEGRVKQIIDKGEMMPPSWSVRERWLEQTKQELQSDPPTHIIFEFVAKSTSALENQVVGLSEK